MNTKQTITGKQDNSLETPRCQEKDFTLSRGWRLERGRCGAGQCVVFIFCSCQNSQVFLFPLLPALNERHLIEFDGFTLIRAAAVVAALLLPLWLHLPYLMPQKSSSTIFIAFYIIVLAVAYALNMPCPFAFPSRWLLFLLPLLLLLLFVVQISSPIFMYGVYYALLFSRLFLTPCLLLLLL